MGRANSSVQSVTVIVALIITCMVILLGYQGILSLTSANREKDLLAFKEDLADDLHLYGNEIGSVTQLEYSLPSHITDVCLHDLSHREESSSSPSLLRFPLLSQALESGDNVVIFSGRDLVDAFHIENLFFGRYPYFNCIEVSDGKLSFLVEGNGDGSIVQESFKTSAATSDTKDVSFFSSDKILYITIPAGSTAAREISVEVVSDSNDRSSEAYLFEPKGTTFSPPVILKIRYFPALVGTCPESLAFVYELENGEKDTYHASRSLGTIDCGTNTATFKINRI